MDEQGNVTATRKYDVYGAVRGDSGDSTTNHKFVGSLGHSSENETGLIYMRARYYDPAIGRFISEDPDCDGRNWYVYCRNNPVNAVDPSGESIATLGYDTMVVQVGYTALLMCLAVVAAYIINQVVAVDRASGVMFTNTDENKRFAEAMRREEIPKGDLWRRIHEEVNAWGESLSLEAIREIARTIKNLSRGAKQGDGGEEGDE